MSIDPSIHQLVCLVCGETLLARTGIILIPPEELGHEADLAARLEIDIVDLAQWILQTTAPNAKLVDLRVHLLIKALDDLCRTAGMGHCLLVSNFDLILAGLRASDRSDVWRTLRSSFKRRRKAFLFGVPCGAKEILPSTEELRGWQTDFRLASNCNDPSSSHPVRSQVYP